RTYRLGRRTVLIGTHDVEACASSCDQEHQQHARPGTTHTRYFLSNTITTGELEPRTDSKVMVLPSGEGDSVSVRTTFAPPATALSLVHVVTSLVPFHLLTVWLVPCIGLSFVTGLPVRSKWVLLSSPRPSNFVWLVTSRAVSVCSIVCVISICAIMPMLLLFS